MKQYICIIAGVLMSMGIFSQTIELSTEKTTSLIFPFPVLHVDRGSAAILVQPVTEVRNILLVKAGIGFFSATNITVVTSDGSVYALPIQFAEHPAQSTYQIPVILHGSIENYAKGILTSPRRLYGVLDHSWDMMGQLTGIYIKDNVLYYQLRLSNASPVDYDIDLLRFYIQDKRRGRRTAVQENELQPLYTAGNIKSVPAYHTSTIVVALDKFTIPDQKHMRIEINEHNGGRHLNMKVGNRKIMQAIMLPDIQ